MLMPILNPIMRAILGARVGGAFDPLSLFATGEVGVYYDPSDMSTLFQDSAGTTPVTAAGQPVGKMLDKSGNGYHATQPTAGKRPLLQTDGTYWWLQGDGIDDCMSTNAIDFTGTNKMTVWAGVRKVDDTVSIICELSAAIGNPGTFYSVTGTNVGGTGYSAISRGSAEVELEQASRNFTYSGVDTAVITQFHDIPGDLSRGWRNGVAGIDGTADKGTGNFGNYPMYLMSRAGSGLFFNGRLYSLIVRGAASSADELTKANQWTASKCGVTL